MHHQIPLHLQSMVERGWRLIFSNYVHEIATSHNCLCRDGNLQQHSLDQSMTSPSGALLKWCIADM